MYNCFIFLQNKQRKNGSSKLAKMDIERFQSGGVKARLINSINLS